MHGYVLSNITGGFVKILLILEDSMHRTVLTILEIYSQIFCFILFKVIFRTCPTIPASPKLEKTLIINREPTL